VVEKLGVFVVEELLIVIVKAAVLEIVIPIVVIFY
jgi:hypothetical protein